MKKCILYGSISLKKTKMTTFVKNCFAGPLMLMFIAASDNILLSTPQRFMRNQTLN